MRRGHSIWDEMRRMQEQMDTLFESFLGGSPFSSSHHPLLEGPTQEGVVTSNYRKPLSDIYETDKEVIATVELPGIEKKDININTTDDGVEIKVEKQEEKTNEKKGMYRLERSYSGFYRHIPLPESVDKDRIRASYKNGVLELRMPKTATKKRRKQILVN